LLIERYGVVPLGVKFVALDVEFRHLPVGDLHALRIEVAIDLAANLEPLGGRGADDQLDNHLMADQGLATPVLCDVGEQTVLDAVPLGGAGRMVGDCHCQARLIGETLKFALPQPDSCAVGAAAIRGDGQAIRAWIAGLTQFLLPATDAFHREGRGIGINPDTDPAVIGRDVVHPIGSDLAKFRDLEVMHPHGFRLALVTQFAATVLEGDCPEIGGIMPPLQIRAVGWRTPQIVGRTLIRAFRCRPRSGPGAGDRRLAGTIASVATCSSAD